MFESMVVIILQSTFHSDIKIIYFFIFLKLFLISTHQNNIKTLKKYKYKFKIKK